MTRKVNVSVLDPVPIKFIALLIGLIVIYQYALQNKSILWQSRQSLIPQKLLREGFYDYSSVGVEIDSIIIPF